MLRPTDRRHPRVSPLGTRDAILSVLANVRAPRVMADVRRARQFDLIETVARRPVCALEFSPGRHDFDEVADMALGWAKGL